MKLEMLNEAECDCIQEYLECADMLDGNDFSHDMYHIISSLTDRIAAPSPSLGEPEAYLFSVRRVSPAGQPRLDTFAAIDYHLQEGEELKAKLPLFLFASPTAAQGQKAVAEVFDAEKIAAVIVDMFIGRTSGETPDELEAIRKQDIDNVLRVLRHESGISCYGYLDPKDKMFWRNQNMCGESRVMMREQKWIPLWTVPVECASPAPVPEGLVLVPNDKYEKMRAALIKAGEDVIHTDECPYIEVGPYVDCIWSDKPCECGACELLDDLRAEVATPKGDK